MSRMATADDARRQWEEELERFRGQSHTPWKDAWIAFSANKLALVGSVIVAFFVLAAAIGPYVAPSSYSAQNLSAAYEKPLSQGHLLGTDDFGRDILSRLLTAIRISILLGMGTTAIALLIGTVAGLLAGYYGGRTDRFINGLVELAWGFPLILIAVIITGAVGPGLTAVVVAVIVLNWAAFARLVRGDSTALRQMEFVLSARALGKRDVTIMVRHLLPNLIGSLLVMGSYYVAVVILVEAGLSFIGMGAQPPLPSLGNMVAEGADYLFTYPWISAVPATVIVLLVLGLNVLGDGLRDILDPRVARER